MLPAGVILFAILAQASAPPPTASGKVCGDLTATSETDRKPCHLDVSLFTASEHPAVFQDVKIRTTDLIEASLSVENKGGSLTYAPLLYSLATYRPVVSELRFRVNQSNNLTTLGTGVQYNPLHPRSGRGAELWTTLWQELDAKGGTAPPPFALKTRLAQRVQKVQAQLETHRDAYRKVSTFPPDATAEQLDELRKRQEILATSITELRAQIVATNAEIAAIDAAEKKRTDDRISTFYRRLISSPLPVVGVAYNVTLFTTLGGTKQDANNNGLNDVEHRLKARTLTLTADSRVSERFQLSGLFSRAWDRATAEEGVDFADVYGLGVTLGGIVAVLDKNYKTSGAYLESFFIPSIVLGGAVEYRRCANSQDVGVTCPDKLERLTALTPFVDLKVSKTTQFRIGAPFRLSKRAAAAGSSTDVGVVTALTLQLGEAK